MPQITGPERQPGEIRIGDRVRRTIPSLFGIGIGAVGTVTRLPLHEGSSIFRVSWDGLSERACAQRNMELITEDRPLAVGDRVRRINGDALGLDVPEGSIGVVEHLGYDYAHVRFDVLTTSTVACFFENLVRVEADTRSAALIIETSERQPGEFFVGDNVVYVAQTDGAGPAIGTEGVVTKVSGTYPHRRYGVIFPDWTGGHSIREMNAVGYSGSGWYCEPRSLTLAADRVEQPVPSQTRAFRLVRYTSDGPQDIPGEVFDSGREAADRAAILTLELGVKVEPRRNAMPTDWRAREGQRLIDGTYSPLPDGWDLEPIKDHFAHLSKQRGHIAFTRDEAGGQADRQSVKRAGAYVREFYPHLSATQVERYSALVSCEGQLRIATERADFKRIYRNGPDSCMSDEFYGRPCHPSEIYAAGDLAIAWLEDDDGRITSRCVVWPEKKLRTRCYGDVEKMRSVLAAAGYSAGNFHGARLLKIRGSDGDIVCPYIDECDSVQGSPEALRVTIHPDHLEISRSGVSTNSTNGWLDEDDDTGDNMTTCDRCDDDVSDGDLNNVVTRDWHGRRNDQSWCDDCRSNHTFYCDGLGEYVSDDLESYNSGNSCRTYSSLWVENADVFVCENNGRVYGNDQRVEMYGGESWSLEAFQQDGFTCASSGKNFCKSEPHTVIDSKTYHDDYLPDLQEDEDAQAAA